MSWIAMAVACIVFVEVLCRLKVAEHTKGMQSVALKSAHVIRSSRISDHWKEKVLLTYSGRILRETLTAFAALLLAVSPFFLLMALDGRIGIPDSLKQVVSLLGIVFCCAVGGSYAYIRGRLF